MRSRDLPESQAKDENAPSGAPKQFFALAENRMWLKANANLLSPAAEASRSRGSELSG